MMQPAPTNRIHRLRARPGIVIVFCAAVAATLWMMPVSRVWATPPAQSDAKPASPATAAGPPHDTHDNMTISAEPFADADAAKRKFGKSNPQKAGILAVNVVFRNTSPQPVQVNLDTIELEVQDSGGQRQSLEPMDIVQVAEIIAYPGGLKEPAVHRFPLGIGGSSPDKKVQKIVDELTPFTLRGDIVAPDGKLAGCLYFNLAHQMRLASTADLYIPDIVTLPEKKPLLFFDIPFGSGTVEP